ncbi:zinc ribbon domain-containing protein [candidate division WOR-3 bacterium]|nr:zinc ribbon domain-containing protein [candidate division WOR-3 bacterium]
MPIREFCCIRCEHEFEELILNQRDEKGLVCPSCGSRRLARRFSAFAVSGAQKKVSNTSKSCGRCSSHSCSTCG